MLFDCSAPILGAWSKFVRGQSSTRDLGSARILNLCLDTSWWRSIAHVTNTLHIRVATGRRACLHRARRRVQGLSTMGLHRRQGGGPFTLPTLTLVATANGTRQRRGRHHSRPAHTSFATMSSFSSNFPSNSTRTPASRRRPLSMYGSDMSSGNVMTTSAYDSLDDWGGASVVGYLRSISS